MVTSAVPQMVTGSDIVNLGALLAQMAAQQQLAAQDQAGYFDPSTFGANGTAGFQPTLARDSLNAQVQSDKDKLALARDQFNAAKADADRQYALDVQRFGLDTANFNYQQRLGEATTKLQELGLLASQRGPANFLAYNYTLNGLAEPQGKAVDPFGFVNGLNQPYGQQASTGSSGTTGGAAGSGGSAGGAPGSGGAQGTQGGNGQHPYSPQEPGPTTEIMPMTQNGPGGWERMQSALNGAPSGTQAAPWWTERTPWSNPGQQVPQNILDQMNQAYQNRDGQAHAQPMARGGVMRGGMAMVGDSKSGRPTGNEEMVISGAPFIVLPHDVIKGSEMAKRAPRAASGGYFDPTQPASTTNVRPQRGGSSGGATAQPVNDGGNGFFSFTTYGPDAVNNAPFLQKTLGNMPGNAWTGRGQDLGAFGKQPFNLSNYLSMLPSEQEMLRGLIETPTAMGGYGGYFADELARAARAGFQGSSLAPAVYG